MSCSRPLLSLACPARAVPTASPTTAAPPSWQFRGRRGPAYLRSSHDLSPCHGGCVRAAKPSAAAPRPHHRAGPAVVVSPRSRISPPLALPLVPSGCLSCQKPVAEDRGETRGGVGARPGEAEARPWREKSARSGEGGHAGGYAPGGEARPGGTTAVRRHRRGRRGFVGTLDSFAVEHCCRG